MLESIKRALRYMLSPRHAVVLAYHSALRQPQEFSIWHHMEARQLEAQLAWLAQHCRCISIAELMDGLASKNLPKKAVAVTFDDGFANNLHVVLPILERYRIPATFFIAAGFIGTDRLLWPEVLGCIMSATRRESFQFGGRQFTIGNAAEKVNTYQALARHLKWTPSTQLDAELRALGDAMNVTESELRAQPLARETRMMSWQELQTLAASELVEIGAHTVNHHPLASLSDAEAEWEIVSGKQMLEAAVSKVRYFAYPYGGPPDYSSQHRRMIVDAGYEASFTTDAECVRPDSQQFSMPRLGVGSEASQSDIAYQVSGGLAIQQLRHRIKSIALKSDASNEWR